MGDLAVGFLFVRRSRYDALCRDLQATQKSEAATSRRLMESEAAAKDYMEAASHWKSRYEAEVKAGRVAKDKLERVAEAFRGVEDIMFGASTAGESVLEDAA